MIYAPKITRYHYQIAQGKGPANYLVFSKTGESVHMPDGVKRVLTSLRFNHCTVWCNLEVLVNEKKQPLMDGDTMYIQRVDTINIAKGRKTDEPSRKLKMEGRTYRLV